MKKIVKHFHQLRLSRQTRLIVVAVVAGLAIAGLITRLLSPGGTAAWFDDTYAYRKKISFTHNAAVTNGRVPITVDTEALTTDKMQSDCDDTRFTDINGAPLRFQLVSGCDSSSTQYDVVIPSVLNGSNVLYIYYGNPGAVTASEDVSTFSALSPSGGAASLASEEKGKAPVAYWPMNEGQGTTINDYTLNNNDGTLSGGSWKSENMCVSDKCLFLDGSDDAITVFNTNSIDVEEQLADSFTYEAWVRPNGAGEGTGGQIFAKGANTWLKVSTLSNGYLNLEASLNLTSSDATVTATARVKDNEWTHVAMSYTNDSDDEITIWINGQAVATSTNGSGSPVE